MEVIGDVVGGEGVGFAIERELAFGDPVGVAADGGTEVGVAGEVWVEVIEAQGDIAEAAVAVGDHHFGEEGAVGDDLGFKAVAVLEGIGFDGGAIG